MIRKDLPTFYYHDHFMEMLTFIEKTYGHILEPFHVDFIHDFRALSKTEQCLYIRMCNRKGTIFSVPSLHYDEIPHLENNIHLLLTKGYVRQLRDEDYAAWLSILTKNDLVKLIQKAGIEGIKQDWLKPRLMCEISQALTFQQVRTYVDDTDYVVQDKTEALEFLLFLYFGKTYADLKSFALRDLGIMRVHANEIYTARFSSVQEAQECFAYSQMLGQLENKELTTHVQLAEYLLSLKDPESEYARSLRAKVMATLGQFFEQHKAFEKAIQLYERSASAISHQRLVRLLYSQGYKDKTKALLEHLIDDPENDEEYFFATDFYARKFQGKRISACTAILREGTTIAIDEAYRDSPEEGVLAFLRRQGYQAWFTENILWQSLFGLLFWDELFGKGNTLSSGFDRLPHCLKDNSFASVYQVEIAQKLHKIQTGQALPTILKTIASYWESPNGLFSWFHLDIETLTPLLSFADKNAVAAILSLMTQNYRAMRDGFPDLMLLKNETIQFVEVKAEGDVIRRNQLTRLRQMQSVGLNCEIYRVNYRYDPDQTYVVIDIETTGGRKNSDRITEIGAVKIKNHQVIDEWHSLINPQRSIPAYITRLTGISNDMVKEAPVFNEVAEDLHAFMKDAIFVAHNVNFDYGFIASEYKRLEKPFRYPKLCTCTGMRRHYPGHSSYGLANLCSIYDINLETHHRALCDAKAAGKLLTLINKKREEIDVDSSSAV
ncbi:MAG: exonuclease domain-containing protein [Pseudomonadota bacterium]